MEKGRIRAGLLIALLALALAAVWLLNVSRPGGPVEGCPQGCAVPNERRAGPLRVMSLNMLHGHPDFEHLDARLEIIAGEIQRLDPDIVLLQEVPWRHQLGGTAAAYLAERSGLNYLYLRANGNRWAIFFEEGEAILSRYPLADPVYAELKPQAGVFEHRVVLGATALTPWGEVQLFVTHLTNGLAEVNQEQSATLLDFVAAYVTQPAIVAGDFNAQDDSPQIEALTQAWLDAYRTANPDDPGFTCCIDGLTQPAQTLTKRIDYLFIVPNNPIPRVVSAHRVFDQPFQGAEGWLWASDHVGLLVEIELGQ